MGMRPTPSRPTFPWASARLTMARTLSAASRCWVMPIDHTWIAPPARRQLVDERVEGRPIHPGQVEQIVELLIRQTVAQLGETLGVGVDEGVVDAAPLDEHA